LIYIDFRLKKRFRRSRFNGSAVRKEGVQETGFRKKRLDVNHETHEIHEK
jgi:hypothetical protein